jgi:hypothetical protein
MPELDPLFSDADDWLEALPPYQRQSFELLLESGKHPDEVARIWLTTTGPSNTFPYGGERFASVFYDKLLEEIEKFICDDARYAADRRQLLQNLGAGKAFLVGAMAAAMAPHLGAAAALLAPAIALILQTVSRMGTRAWCKARAQLREATPAPAAPAPAPPAA